MAKMTKAQAHRRLNEAARKVQLVYLNAHDHLTLSQNKALQSISDTLIYKIAQKLK
jgi:hypothetical protein